MSRSVSVLFLSILLVAQKPVIVRFLAALSGPPPAGYRVVGEMPQIGVTVLEGPDEIGTLAASDGVLWAEPNGYYRLAACRTDPRFAEQWNMAVTRVTDAWRYTRGAGITIAVVDTGVDCSRDLRCVAGYDFLSDDDDPADEYGHGTHVAGIAAGRWDGRGIIGVAPEAKIMPVRVLSGTGWGTLEDVAYGIIWAVDHGARVINISLVGGDAETLQLATLYASEKGVPIAAAAGNQQGPPLYPAAYPWVIAVTAVDNTDHLPYWSNRGDWVDIAAPGVQILSIFPGGEYRIWNGTSMATPHVAGALALVLSQNPARTDAKSILISNARRPADWNRDYGAGIVDASAMVRAGSTSARPWTWAEDRIFLPYAEGIYRCP